MNYAKIYQSLIERGKTRNLVCYKESHHIVPRCMGGSDDKENLVDLTPEEHYLAHQLLVKMYPNNHKLVRAAFMMTANRPSNKMYGWIRRRFREAQSIRQTGKKNSQYNKIWITDGISNKIIQKSEYIPEGWKSGRIMTNIKPKKQKVLVLKKVSLCKNCIEKSQKEIATYWYNIFLKSNASSIREFVKLSDYDRSHVSFIKMLKKHISEFNPRQGKKYSH